MEHMNWRAKLGQDGPRSSITPENAKLDFEIGRHSQNGGWERSLPLLVFQYWFLSFYRKVFDGEFPKSRLAHQFSNTKFHQFQKKGSNPCDISSRTNGFSRHNSPKKNSFEI
jgi:hypothetical protein